jgi:hypothetical protein
MSRVILNDFEKVTSGHKILSWEIQKFSIFSKIVKDRVMVFSGMIDLSICVYNINEHVGRHFRLSLEVKKEIKIFKFNFSTQNLYHIIWYVLKCPKQLTPPDVSLNFRLFKKNQSHHFANSTALIQRVIPHT